MSDTRPLGQPRAPPTVIDADRTPRECQDCEHNSDGAETGTSRRGPSATWRPDTATSRAVTDMIRYMLDVTQVSEDELTRLAHQVRQERMRRRGLTITCLRCGAQTVARADAKFCSTRCRVAAHRAGRRSA